MQEYLIRLISAAVLSGVAQAVTPEKWKKYLNVIAGVMLINVIASPIFELRKIDLFSGFSYSDSIDEFAQKKAVVKELEKAVAEDSVKRLKESLGRDCTVEVVLDVNDMYEIESVKEMRVWMHGEINQAKAILQKVYCPGKILFQK